MVAPAELPSVRIGGRLLSHLDVGDQTISSTMSHETTALVLREIGGPFALETIKLDALEPNEALVEIHAVGICHTDISCATGVIPAHTPAVFGHEGVCYTRSLVLPIVQSNQCDQVQEWLSSLEAMWTKSPKVTKLSSATLTASNVVSANLATYSTAKTCCQSILGATDSMATQHFPLRTAQNFTGISLVKARSRV